MVVRGPLFSFFLQLVVAELGKGGPAKEKRGGAEANKEGTNRMKEGRKEGNERGERTREIRRIREGNGGGASKKQGGK